MAKNPNTTPFDAAEYIEGHEAEEAFFAEAVQGYAETGDYRLVTSALGAIARARGMSKVAADAGLSRTALYKALSPTGDPRISTLTGVTKALGLPVIIGGQGQVSPRPVAHAKVARAPLTLASPKKKPAEGGAAHIKSRPRRSAKHASHADT